MTYVQIDTLIEQLQTLAFGDLIDADSQQFVDLKQQILALNHSKDSHYFILLTLLSLCEFKTDEASQALLQIDTQTLNESYAPLYNSLTFIIRVRLQAHTESSATIKKIFVSFSEWKTFAPPEFIIFTMIHFLVTLRSLPKHFTLAHEIMTELLQRVQSFEHPLVVAAYYYSVSLSLQMNEKSMEIMDLALNGFTLAKQHHFINFEVSFLNGIAIIYENEQLIEESFKYQQKIIDNPEYDQISTASRALSLLNISSLAIKMKKYNQASQYVQQLESLIERSNRRTELSILRDLILLEVRCFSNEFSYAQLWEQYKALVKTYTSKRNHFHFSPFERSLLELEATIQSLSNDNSSKGIQMKLQANLAAITLLNSQDFDRKYELATIYRSIADCYDQIEQSAQALHYFRLYEQAFSQWMQSKRVIYTHKQLESSFQKAHNNQLTHAAHALQNQYQHDALTGLYSRHYLDELLSKHTQPNGYLLLDIDLFKTYNDTFGHLEGNTILHKLAHAIQSLLQTNEYAFRFGGEEFLILCFHDDQARFTQLAYAIHHAFHTLAIPFSASPHGIVTTSIGGLWLSAPRSFNQAFECIDTLLYTAKSSGRNTSKIVIDSIHTL